VTGQGLSNLLERLQGLAHGILPGEGAIALNRRQSGLLELAAISLNQAACASDLPVLAEELRQARNAFDRLTGRAGIENVLDALFSRFCLGK
jgi:tRNA modification GTPase